MTAESTTRAAPASAWEIPPEHWHEPLLSSWKRRLLTVPGLLVLTGLDLALLPLLLVFAAGLDAARRRPWTATRFHLALASVLVMHIVGLALLFGAWIGGSRWLGGGRARRDRITLRIEVWWARRIWGIAARLYRISLTAHEKEVLEGGPILLLSRHASLLDTLLPVLFAGRFYGLRLRFVMKRELLWDPCLDVLGHRVPTAFVRRHGRETERAVALVEGLLDDLGPEDAVVLFPEGTRFTPEKQRRALASLAERSPRAYARASRLRHVLPPHPAGALALLEHDPGADVVFCAHTGLEGVNHLKDLLGGTLLGREVRACFWRVPAAEIPDDREALMEWLFDWWERIDRWIEEHRS